MACDNTIVKRSICKCEGKRIGINTKMLSLL